MGAVSPTSIRILQLDKGLFSNAGDPEATLPEKGVDIPVGSPVPLGGSPGRDAVHEALANDQQGGLVSHDLYPARKEQK